MQNFHDMTDTWKQKLTEKSNPEKIKVFSHFFKTGPGEYGEGDCFIGLSVPQNREISKMFHDAPLSDIDKMTLDKIHEYRLAGFLALVERYRKSKDADTKHKIAQHYLTICNRANNWDLVDLSAPYIIGEELLRDKCIAEIRHLSKSECLWERRVAIVSTLMPIRKGKLDLAFEMCKTHISDPHPLIRKAVGWVLRECGKKNKRSLEVFLSDNINRISAISLSYALEKFTPDERTYWRNLRKTQ